MTTDGVDFSCAPGARERPIHLGATWDGLGTNFAVFSAGAGKIEFVCSMLPASARCSVLALPCFDGEVWHGYLPDAGPGLVYGYRAYGPYEPRNGKRFNHHKLLLDPYARQLTGDCAGPMHCSAIASDRIVPICPSIGAIPVRRWSRLLLRPGISIGRMTSAPKRHGMTRSSTNCTPKDLPNCSRR